MCVTLCVMCNATQAYIITNDCNEPGSCVNLEPFLFEIIVVWLVRRRRRAKIEVSAHDPTQISYYEELPPHVRNAYYC